MIKGALARISFPFLIRRHSLKMKTGICDKPCWARKPQILSIPGRKTVFFSRCRNTDLCSNPFRERTMIMPRGARGDSILPRTHWSLIAPRSRSVPLRASNPKISLPFFCGSSPDPSAERRKRRKEILGCVGGSVSKSFVRSFHFPNSAFSDFPPPRSAPVANPHCIASVRSPHSSTSAQLAHSVRVSYCGASVCELSGFV